MTKTKPRRRKAVPITLPDHRAVLARRLDLMADAELQHGHIAAAERLAWQAAALRIQAEGPTHG